MNLSDLLFSFSGRVNRAPYWLAGVATSFCLMGLIWVVLGLAFAGRAGASTILALMIVVALLWVGLALGAKRLHDRDKSAWWLVLFYVVPAILHSAGRHAMSGGRILALIGLVISIWALIELGFLRGTLGPNRFGPDPLPPRAAV
jgi:uncharacterized membrane protein YhaH (DUF805 family)